MFRLVFGAMIPAAVIAALCFLALASAGCRHEPPRVMRTVETVQVQVPVPVLRVPPPELTAPIDAPPPQFILPSDPQAVVGLAEEGVAYLKALIDAYQTRIAAWVAWANVAPPDVPAPPKETPDAK